MKNTVRRINLEGELGEKFGKVWYLNVKSPAEAIRAIDAQRRGFRKYFLDTGEKGIGYEVIIGDQGLQQEEALLYPTPMRDDYTFVPIPQGGKNRAFGMIMMGIAIFVTAGVAGGVFAAAGTGGTFTAGTFASGALAGQAGGIYGGPAGKAAALPAAAAGTSRGLLSALGAGASRLIAPIGIIVSAIVASKAFFDMMQGPGGFWDIRYRRHLQKEMEPFIDRREKQEINIGLRTVRVTTAPAQRGTAHIFSTQEAVRKGIPIYDSEFEAFSKGLYL